MTITDAIEQIDAWAARQDSAWTGIPRTIRAMCVGARQEDVSAVNKGLVEHSRDMMVRGALAMGSHRCSQAETCKAFGGCSRFIITARAYATLSVAMRCMEKSGPDFLMPAAWPENDDILVWVRQLAELNGLSLQPVSAPEVTVVQISLEGDESIADALDRALRERQVDAQTKKPTVQ